METRMGINAVRSTRYQPLHTFILTENYGVSAFSSYTKVYEDMLCALVRTKFNTQRPVMLSAISTEQL